MTARPVRLGVALAVLLVTSAPAASAQFPALAPVIQTRAEWADAAGAGFDRSLNVSGAGPATIALDVGFRIFMPAEANLVCHGQTRFTYSVGLVTAPPDWARVTFDGSETATVEVTVPQGHHVGGWPAGQQWHRQPGPAVTFDWDPARVEGTMKREVQVGGDGPVTLVEGGCAPDPMPQDPVHLPETMNLTKFYVPPPERPAEQTTCPDGSPGPVCTTIRDDAAEGASSGPGAAGLLLAVLAVGILRRRRG